MEMNEIVRRVRENKPLTQENLASAIGVHVTTMIRYESMGAKNSKQQIGVDCQVIRHNSIRFIRVQEESTTT